MTILALTIRILAAGISLAAISRCERQDIGIQVATELAMRARKENS